MNVLRIMFLLLLSLPVQAIELVDDRGNLLILDKPAQRVIALAPHIVEIVYAVGRGEALVGAVSYSNFPEAAKALPEIGNDKNFSVESVLRLRPDLILAWRSGNSESLVNKFEELGLQVYWMEPETLEDVGQSMLDIGLLLGAKEAKPAAAKFARELKRLRDIYSHKEPVSVFYQVWHEPIQTLNGKHLISDVIRLCGGRNVFADAPALAPQVSVESVLRANPQVIVASGSGEERPPWLNDWNAWPQLQASKNAQLYSIPPDLLQRHTPRVLQGAEIMCEQIDQARQL